MRTKNKEYFKKIEAFADDYMERNGISPTMQEIAAGVGISKTTVARYLSFMREQGMLDYSGRRNITTAQAREAREGTVRVPVLGAVSCGIPRYAEENIEEYVRLPVALFGSGEFFLLRAYGDSMVGAGINDGDLVLIRRQGDAEPGQIVLALMEDEATLKRYYPDPEHGRIRLHPENGAFSDIFTEGCTIQGVAVKVLKDLA